jgi:integrase
MAELADKLRDKTLTIREAIDIASEGAPESRVKNLSGFANKLTKVGVDLNSPFTELGKASNLEVLSKQAGQPFAALTTVQNAVNGAAASLDMEPPFPDYSAKAQSAGLIGGKQKRGTKKFEAVPEARITLPAITKAIAQVEDPQTRAALALNALVPLRPGEIAGLTLDDIDLDTGMLTEKVRGLKTRAKIKIPDVALEIIRDMAEIAEEEGRSNIFDTTVTKMTQAINAPGGLRDLLKPYASEMGREIEGAKDFRKLIPSIVAMELGFREEASAIMGHADAGKTMDSIAKMSSEHYISRIMRQGEEAKPTIALRALQNMYGEVLGLNTLNELPAALNVSAKRISGSNTAIDIVREQGDILQPQEQRELTPEEKQLIEDRRNLASAQIEAQTAEAQLRAEQAKTQQAEEVVKREGLTEEAARIKAEEQELKRSARAKIKEEAKAEAAAKRGDITVDSVRNVFDKLNEYYDKLPTGVKKAIPLAGTAASLFAAQEKGVQAKEAFEREEYGTAAFRAGQAVEEVVSPLPVTTGDIEQIEPLPKELRSGPLGVTAEQISQQIRNLPQRTSTEDQMNQLLNK